MTTALDLKAGSGCTVAACTSLLEVLTPSDSPIACSLDAADRSSKLAEMKALGESGLESVEASDSRAILAFRDAPGIADRLAAVVEAESDCCPFLTMSVLSQDDRLVLSIDAPDGAAAVLAELVAAFRGEEPVAR
jgi:hypothetical protein